MLEAELPSLRSLTEAVSCVMSSPGVDQHDRLIVVKCILEQVEAEGLGGLVSSQFLVWERLNTGHWAEVWPGWRTLYGLVSLARLRLTVTLLGEGRCRQEKDVLKDLVKMCDLGLLLGGPDILDGALETLAQSLTDYLASSPVSHRSDSPVNKKPKLSSNFCDIKPHSLPLSEPLEDIPVLQYPDIPTFVTQCKTRGLVTKLRGAMEDWPALTSWSVERLVRLAGPKTVPVEIGRRYTDHDWTQQLMTVESFARDFLCPSPSRVGYLAQHQLLDQVPALGQDILTPDYCYTGNSDQPEVNVWIGPAGTVSPAHTDNKHNLLCQVLGYKYVAIFYQDMTDSLYPDLEPMFHNTSRVDLDHPDTEMFPLVQQLKGHHTILGPGEMLYIPPRVWHYVRSLDISFSVSFWWE